MLGSAAVTTGNGSTERARGADPAQLLARRSPRAARLFGATVRPRKAVGGAGSEAAGQLVSTASCRCGVSAD
jgi:hypothetical protein